MCAETAPLSVLIVDDHGMVRESLRLAIEREEGLTVVGEASDGIEGVRSALALRPDVVLMDLDMPGLNGIDACQKIRLSNPDAKILILTASAERKSVLASLIAGAKGYVVKVASNEELIKSIRAVGAGETILHPAIASGVVEELIQLLSEPPNQSPPTLNPQEQEVLRLVSGGWTDREIASELSVSETDAKEFVSTVVARTGSADRSEFVDWASRTDSPATTAPEVKARPRRTSIERLGRYELIGRLGQGGMATVFRALDPELNREVAVKV